MNIFCKGEPFCRGKQADSCRAASIKLLSLWTMATVKGSAAYKKKDGTVTISKDQKSIIWTPVAPRGAPPGVILNIAEITSMYLLKRYFPDFIDTALMPPRFTTNS